METIAAVHVMVPPVMNLHRKEPVVPEGCRYLGPIMNCIATKTATTMSARAKFSMSRFMGVLIDLFKRTTRTTIVLPKRSIRTMIEKATLRPMYSVGSIASCKPRFDRSLLRHLTRLYLVDCSDQSVKYVLKISYKDCGN